MSDRRKQPVPTDAEGYLRQLPSLALLNRLPTAMMGVGVNAEIAFANPACADMLGYDDGEDLTSVRLSHLLTGHQDATPAMCLATLRADLPVVEWNHRDEYVIRTMVSSPLLLRDTDTLLLVGIVDVTAWLWETERVTSRRSAPTAGAMSTASAQSTER